MIRETLFKTIISIALLVLLLAFAGLWFEKELTIGTNWLLGRVGFYGLCLLLFITDTIVTPFSPDLILIVVAQSGLADDWLPYVFVLGLMSITGGMTGWLIGKRLGHTELIQRYYQQLNDEQGLTIVLVTHEQDIVQYARRALEFRDGRIRRDRIVEDRSIAREVLPTLPLLDAAIDEAAESVVEEPGTP